MANTYLTRTPSSEGNRKTFTFSGWFKRSDIAGRNFVLSGGQDNQYQNAFGIEFGEKLYVYDYNITHLITNASYKDVSAWYHVVVAVDTTQSTASDRMKLYVNGEQITSFSTANYPGQNENTGINSAHPQQVGSSGAGAHSYDGYMAEVHLTDGTTYAASTFGETDTTGVWVPKVGPTVTYGTNGFYLKFANSGAMGTDSSGQSNTFSVGAGTLRQVPDSPTNVFPTLNPLVATSPKPTLTKGNLESTPSGNGNHTTGATQFMPENSGKWYAETVLTYVSEQSGAFTIQDPNNIKDSANTYSGQYSVAWQASGTDYFATRQGGSSETNSTSTAISAGDIFQIAYDSTNGKVWFGRNNTWITGNPSTATTPTYSSITGDKVFTTTGYRASSGSSYTAQLVNFGQDSSFGGNKTAQNNADANGKGDFYYAPPTGFLALCTDNLSSTLTIPVNKGADNFNPVLYTGNDGASQAITGVGFQPNWTWIKERDSTSSHFLMDAVRGATKFVQSSENAAETDNSDVLQSFDSDGFTVGTSGGTNASNIYVSWNWKAGGTAPANTYAVKVVSDSGNKYRFDDYGTSAITLELQEGGTFTFDQSDSSNAGHPLRFSSTADGTHGGGSEYTTGVTTTGTPGQAGAKTVITVAGSAPTLYYYCTQHSGMGGQANTGSLFGFTNVKGTIQSVVSPNTTAGFSVVTYTGNDSTSTVGHGLGAAPGMVLAKRRSGTDDFMAYHKDVGKDKYIVLNEAEAEGSSSNFWGTSTPDSSVFGIRGPDTAVNKNGSTYIAYVFAEVEGYSKMGSYTGNGSTDGSFVYTGFRPAWVMRKSTTAETWSILDSTRSTINAAQDVLRPNINNAEGSATWSTIDILSNGFKMRATDASTNGSSNTYIYMAFAENPFVTSTGKPVTAR